MFLNFIRSDVRKCLGGGGLYLLLHGPSSALGQLTVVVHGGCSAPRRFSIFPPLWVQHPPGTFPCSLVLDAHKAAVQ